MTESGYSRSEWGKLSIQDRIKAMNETLDNVEHSVSPIDLRKIEKNASIDSGVLAIPATAPPQKRSSVVDIWRQREGKSASPTASKGTSSNKSKSEESLQSVKASLANRFQVMSSSENFPKANSRSEEKKEEDIVEKLQRDEDSQSARDLWNKRVTAASFSTSTVASRNESIQNSGVEHTRKWSNYKSDSSISQTVDIDIDGKSQSSSMSRSQSIYKKQAVQRANTGQSVHDKDQDSSPSQPLDSTSQPTSILNKWKNRIAGGDSGDDVPKAIGARPVVVPPASVQKKIFSTTLSQAGLDDAGGLDMDASNLESIGDREHVRDSSDMRNPLIRSVPNSSTTPRSSGGWAKRMNDHLQQIGASRPGIHELDIPADKPDPPRRNQVLQRWNSRADVQNELSNEGTNLAIHEHDIPVDKPDSPPRNQILHRWNSKKIVQDELSSEGANPAVNKLDVPAHTPDPPRRNQVLYKWNRRTNVQDEISNEGTNHESHEVKIPADQRDPPRRNQVLHKCGRDVDDEPLNEGTRSAAESQQFVRQTPITLMSPLSSHTTMKPNWGKKLSNDKNSAQKAETDHTGAYQRNLRTVPLPSSEMPNVVLPKASRSGESENVDKQGDGSNVPSFKLHIANSVGRLSGEPVLVDAPIRSESFLESKTRHVSKNAAEDNGSAIDPWSRWGTKPRQVKSIEVAHTSDRTDNAPKSPQSPPAQRSPSNPLKIINIFNVLPSEKISTHTEKSKALPESQEAQNNHLSNDSHVGSIQANDTDEDTGRTSRSLHALDQSANQTVLKHAKPAILPRPAKLPRKSELPVETSEHPQLSGTLSSQSSAFNAWDGLFMQSDSVDHNNTKQESTPSRKKKDLVNMGKKHAVNGLAHKIAVAQSVSMVSMSSKDEDSFRLEEALSLRSIGKHPSMPQSRSHNEGTREDQVDDTESSDANIPNNRNESVSDFRPRGNTYNAQPQRKTMPLALRIERDTFAVPAQPRESKVGPDPRTKKPAVVSKLPAPKFCDNRKVSHGRTRPVDAPSGHEQQDRDEDKSIESATPKSKKLTTERLVAQKRKLQAQRRKLKSHSFECDDCESNIPTTPVSSIQQPAAPSTVAITTVKSGLSKIDENGSGSMSALRGLELMRVADIPVSSMGPDATELHGLSGLAASQKYKFPLKSPRSEAGVSDGGFSFFSDTHSAVSSNMSAPSSLANRAEKLLQERRRKQIPQTSDEDDERAMILLRDMLYSATSPLVQEKLPTLQEKGILKQGSILKPSKERSASERLEVSQPAGDRAGLSSRYNTSSRFIDNETSESLSNPVTSDGASLEQSMSTESVASSYRSTGTATTESDSRWEKKKSLRKNRKSLSNRAAEEQPIITDSFVSESASNVDAFSSACNATSLKEIAADLAGDVSTGIAALHIDKLAREGVQAIRDFVGTKGSPSKMKIPKCDGMVPFDEEDIAIEVEYMEDSVDGDDACTEQEMGVCTAVDDALERGSAALNCPEDVKVSDHSSVPAGQPSFEEPSVVGKKAAYV